MSESGIADEKDEKDEKKDQKPCYFRVFWPSFGCEKYLVPRPRLELGRLAAADIESAASTDSAIGATLCPATFRLLPGA